MSGPFGSSQWMYSSGGFYDFPIEQSLKFNDDDSSYLSRTPASAGNRKTWTWSGWVKFGNINADKFLFSATSGTSDGLRFRHFSTATSPDALMFYLDDTTGGGVYTNAVFRDTSAWYHIVLAVDTTQATSSNRIKIYVNGEQQTFASATYPSQNYDCRINNSVLHNIGAVNASAFLDGYLAEVNFIDGQALDATSFGEFKSGVWIPKEYTGVYNDAGNDVAIYNAVTATEHNGSNFVNLLDGNTSTVWGSTGGTGTATVTFSPTQDTTTSCRIYGALGATSGQVGGTTNLVVVNGTDVTAKFKSANAYLTPTWIDVSTEAGSALSSISIGIVSGVANTGLNALELNGTVVEYVPAGTNGFRLSFQNDTVSEGFNTVTYTGDASSRAINGLGLAPDLVWIKNRSGAYHHGLFDSVRGANKVLKSSDTSAEGTFTQQLMSFNSDGFSLGNNSDGGNYANISGNNYVAWCWDAGSGSPVSNTSGSITSTVKANTAYGFSIVSYTGNGTSGATVGHGLSSAPELLIVKNRDSGVRNWDVYTTTTGNGNRLFLNTTSASVATDSWNYTTPSSSVFTLGGSGNVNNSGDTFIAYAFHSVTNYSKVGSYSGSGASGNTITTGFKPAFLMIKRTDSAAEWVIADGTRNTSGNRNKQLYPNTSGAEYVDDWVTFSDTGFTMTSGFGYNNASGGTYIYIAFADTRDNAFWRDQSGNGNDWQPNNLTYQDSLPDSMTNNFATMNPNDDWVNTVLSEGNLKIGTNGTYGIAKGGFWMTSGKWYWELTPLNGGSSYPSIGVASTEATSSLAGFLASDVSYLANGQKYQGNSFTAYGSSFTAGDVIGAALDMDSATKTITFYKNNVSQGAITLTADQYTVGITVASPAGGGGTLAVANFGQDSSFAGNKTAQGNTDANGIGDFYYAPPSGYLALCTANLPDPVIDPAQDDVPSDYFNTVLYTGDGTNSKTVTTNFGFTPDLIWNKNRSNAASHALQSSPVSWRYLSSDTTAAEGSAQIGSVGDNSYLIASGNSIWNASGNTYASWCWKAGNGTSSNTDGTITSTVSVNQKAGFSIVSYTGTAASATVGHGLGATPAMLIVKKRTSAAPGGARGWAVWHQSLATDKVLELNTNAAEATEANFFIEGNINSTTFGVGADYNTGWTDDYIAYCFAEIPSYSSFGKYVGNGSTDGPMLHLGFEPAFFLAKRIDGIENWFMIDNARHPYNDGNIPRLLPNTSDAEAEDASIAGDFLSNGFKIRATQNMINTSGANYIYMAFASNPFKYANAR